MSPAPNGGVGNPEDDVAVRDLPLEVLLHGQLQRGVAGAVDAPADHEQAVDSAVPAAIRIELEPGLADRPVALTKEAPCSWRRWRWRWRPEDSPSLPAPMPPAVPAGLCRRRCGLDVAPAAAVEVEPRAQAVATPFGLREVLAAVGEELPVRRCSVGELPPAPAGPPRTSRVLGPDEELGLGHQDVANTPAPTTTANITLSFMGASFPSSLRYAFLTASWASTEVPSAVTVGRALRTVNVTSAPRYSFLGARDVAQDALALPRCNARKRAAAHCGQPAGRQHRARG